MIKEIIHAGLCVSDLERSVEFYNKVMGLRITGRLSMEGRESELLFGRPGCRADIAYLKGGDDSTPPVELIEFVSEDVEKRPPSLFSTSIAELCFKVEDIEAEYRRMSALGVRFLSEPQAFDFTALGMGRSKAVYFTDPDGIILELIQEL